MPVLRAVIAENPMSSFQRLIRDAPESRSMPSWGTATLINLAMGRGRFDGLISAENSVPLVRTTPILFIHSKAHEVVSYRQTHDLVDLYSGPKSVWFPDVGTHVAIWDVDHATYETRGADFLTGQQ
jgi:fermentation-respiration switch protein FrsA (DUF1100 family)